MTKRTASKGAGLISVLDASEAIGCDRRTLKSWIENDDAPGLGIRIAGRWYVRSAVLSRLLLGGFAPHSASDSAPAAVAAPSEGS
jgi:hypothetical protein